MISKEISPFPLLWEAETPNAYSWTVSAAVKTSPEF